MLSYLLFPRSYHHRIKRKLTQRSFFTVTILCKNLLIQKLYFAHLLATPTFLFLASSLLDPTRIYLDYWKGKLQKGFWLHHLNIDEQLKIPLIGFHAFTGNDYISSFFKKRKSVCWKAMNKNQIFVEAFRQFWDSWYLSDDITTVLEHFTCALYGYPRERSINEVRTKLFEKKYVKNGKVIDMALLPPL